MKANNLPEGISIAGNDFLIIDNGKETKRVALDKTTEFFRGEIFGGGGQHPTYSLISETGI